MTKKKNAKPPKFKDMVGPQVVEELARVIHQFYKPFKAQEFIVRGTAPPFATLELKARIGHLAEVLSDFLPSDYSKAARILVQAAPIARGFNNWVLCFYVEKFGLEHFDDSVAAMKELTKHGSAELAIRPYMIRYTRQMLSVVMDWTGDPNEHVRRLAAEGTRPRGVWMPHVEAFKKDPQPVIQILEQLKADPSLYVRKAVANNLNDISKDNPELFLKTARKWQKGAGEDTSWIIKRAARTLIKQGHPEAMALFGFGGKAQIKNVKLTASPAKVSIGESTQLTLDLKSAAKSSQKLAIDYRVHYVKASGKTSAKIFKWTERELGEGEKLQLTKKHSFAEQSTRKHYPGEHLVEVTINGEVWGITDVVLSP
ncbi:MAG: DNA alkylation repair protein [bacterium]